MVNPSSLSSFKGGETSFGIFYPKGYLLSVYADVTAAERAAADLRAAGFAADDVLVASGEEVLARHREFNADVGLVGHFKQFVSRHFGDEGGMLDALIALAERGHAFVLAYAPGEAATARAADAVRGLRPVLLRKYDAFTTADLA